MSKKSKKKAKLKRRNEKAARKAAQRARYEGYMRAGNNTKSKRSQRKSKKGGRAKNHPLGECGNPGCTKCYGVHFRPFFKNNKPHGMPQWMWLRWSSMTKEEQKKVA
jgi:hypothetical protein